MLTRLDLISRLGLNGYLMKRTLFLFSATLLLCAGCVKKIAEPVSTPSTPAVAATPTAASTVAASSATPGALSALYRLDLSTVGELPAGVGKTADQKGRPESALSFSGESTKLELPWDINVEKHPQVTITAWARFMGNPEDKAQFQVVSSDDGDFDRSVGLDGRAGEWGWSAFAGQGGVIGGLPVKSGEWVFLAVTYDQEGDASQLTVGEESVPAKEGQLGKGHPFVWIGGNPSFGEHFVGDIAHVQVFDRVLTPEEIATVRDQ